MDFKSGQQWARFDIDDSDDVDYLKVVDGVIASVEDHSSSSSSGIWSIRRVITASVSYQPMITMRMILPPRESQLK